MKAKKLKIQVKRGRFSIHLPALRFSTFRWIFKVIIRFYPSKVKESASPSSGEYEFMETILKNMTYEDIGRVISRLEQEEPFKLVDIESYNTKDGRIAVKIYTI